MGIDASTYVLLVFVCFEGIRDSRSVLDITRVQLALSVIAEVQFQVCLS